MRFAAYKEVRGPFAAYKEVRGPIGAQKNKGEAISKEALEVYNGTKVRPES